MKIDLHVHSKYSTRPSQWVLQKLGCQECYTEPRTLYRLAKKQGMSLVTITDHNVIDGCLEIAGKSVRGIDSYFNPGEQVTKGEVFGMIRIGSQVDLVVPLLAEMSILVQPGDKVRAGETVLIA